MKMIRNLLGVVALIFAAGSTASTVYIDPDAVSVAPGDPFSVTVRADFVDVGGFTQGGFFLTWDSSVASLLSSESNSNLSNIFFPPTITANSFDYAFATCLACDAADVRGAADSAFALYTLNFQVAPAAAIGQSNLTLDIGLDGDQWLNIKRGGYYTCPEQFP